MFIVGIEDRHADVDVHLFYDKDNAIEFARNEAIAGGRGIDGIEEHGYPGWVYYATYSCEGECTWVIERNPEDG